MGLPATSKYDGYIYDMKGIFKALGGLFFILFLVSAILQYNDPDPYIWILVYSIGALISLGVVFDKMSFKIPLFAGIVALVGFFYVFPDSFQGFTIGEGALQQVEEGRESFGLLISALVMFAFALRIRFRKGS